jgi:hypothetical protein
MKRLQDWGLNTLGFPILLFLGRGVFQYTVIIIYLHLIILALHLPPAQAGILPKRHPIHVVVGRPIAVQQVESPSPEEVERLHGEYMAALVLLYRWQLAGHIHSFIHSFPLHAGTTTPGTGTPPSSWS